LGYPVFEPVATSSVTPSGTSAKQDFFYCKRAGINAVGEYTEEGFVVLKGSIGRSEVSGSFAGHPFEKLRDALMSQGKVGIENGVLVFKEDILFTSPSGASSVACGSPSNGWKEWKTEKGVTLHDLKRAAPIEI
jgi:hypothetical protein